MAGMVIGVSTAVTMHSIRFFPGILGSEIKISYLWVAWWSFAAAVIGTILISLLTKPYDRERLRGLVCWIPLEKEA